VTLDPAMIGDRTDPHAQARTARQQPFLLHSMSVFHEMFKILFTYKKIESVLEVGVESGQVSSIYTELGASKVYCIDPYPTTELRETLAKNPKLELVERPSPQVLAELPAADLYVLDGDHNYAVLHGELTYLLKHAPDAVIALHDVLWPWSRRDLYYEPTLLTGDAKHEVSFEDGPTIWHDELTPAGFVGHGSYSVAVEAGGERNGVLTAIEDAIAEAEDDWLFVIVPAVFGMGVMVRKNAPFAKKMLDALKPYTSSKLLAMMENNRIAMYTRVLQLQYEAVAAAENHDRFAEEIARQRLEIERLHGDLARQSHELQVLRDQNAELQRHLRDPDLAAEPNIGTVLHQLSRVAGKQLRKARNGS
jgi:hypothetical protein